MFFADIWSSSSCTPLCPFSLYNFKFHPKKCSSWYLGWSFPGKTIGILMHIFATNWKVAGIRWGFPNFIQFPHVFGCFSGTWIELDHILWFVGVKFWMTFSVKPYCRMFPAGCQARFSWNFGICDRIYELNRYESIWISKQHETDVSIVCCTYIINTLLQIYTVYKSNLTNSCIYMKYTIYIYM